MAMAHRKQSLLTMRLGRLKETLMVIMWGSGLRRRILNLASAFYARKVFSLIMKEREEAKKSKEDKEKKEKERISEEEAR